MSKQNTTEIDAFTRDERMPKKKAVVTKERKEEKSEYPCVGGNPKMRREMKRHKDMMKKFGKERVEMEDDDD